MRTVYYIFAAVLALALAAFVWDPPNRLVGTHSATVLGNESEFANNVTDRQFVHVLLEDGRNVRAVVWGQNARPIREGSGVVVRQFDTLILQRSFYEVLGSSEKR